MKHNDKPKPDYLDTALLFAALFALIGLFFSPWPFLGLVAILAFLFWAISQPHDERGPYG